MRVDTGAAPDGQSLLVCNFAVSALFFHAFFRKEVRVLARWRQVDGGVVQKVCLELFYGAILYAAKTSRLACRFDMWWNTAVVVSRVCCVWGRS